jgi:hypothetical protein
MLENLIFPFLLAVWGPKLPQHWWDFITTLFEGNVVIVMAFSRETWKMIVG